MTRRIQRLLLPTAAAGLALALATVPVLARPPHGRGGPHGGPHGGPDAGAMHGFLGGLIADDLDLSDAQREEIHGILDAARAEGEPLWAEVNASRGQLMDASAAEPFSEADVRAAAARLANAEAEIAIHRAGIMGQVRTVLTPEQRERAQELMQRMRERREDSREGRRSDWGG